MPRIQDLPDLGAVTDASAIAAAKGGTGKFLATALATYLNSKYTSTFSTFMQSFLGMADAPTARQALGDVGRNLLINPSFIVNQRNAVSGTPVGGAGTYTLDRWRVVVSGQSLVWTSDGVDTTVTAPLGGVEQVIEGGLIAGGTYCLSWAGTAAAVVNGAPVLNGGTFALPVNTAATVRFTGGTVTRAQLEAGTKALAFERRQLAHEIILCQRYYQTAGRGIWGWALTSNSAATNIVLPVRMRAAPTVAFLVSNMAVYRNSGNSLFPAPLTIADAGADPGGLRLFFSHGGSLTVDELWGSLVSDVISLSAEL